MPEDIGPGHFLRFRADIDEVDRAGMARPVSLGLRYLWIPTQGETTMLGNVFQSVEPENVQGRIMLMRWGGGVWAIAANDRDAEPYSLCVLLTDAGSSNPAFSIIRCNNDGLFPAAAIRPDCVILTPSLDTLKLGDPADAPLGTLGIVHGECCIWVGGGAWRPRWLRFSDGNLLADVRGSSVPLFSSWKIEIKAQGWSKAQTLISGGSVID